MNKILAITFAALIAASPASAQGFPESFRALTGHAVSVTTGSTETATPLTQGTLAVRLVSTVAAFVRVGFGSQTATTDDIYLPADTPLVLDAGQGENVAVIRLSSDGTLYVTEMTK